jgi:RNA polymerase sigma-70 factor (ECF subfamily)
VASEPALADEQLVSLSKDGSVDAFNRLVERHQRAVYNLCLRLTGSRESAEDATQEAFLAAYRALSGFRGGNIRSWLFRIAANQSRDELRRRRRRGASRSLEELAEASEVPFELTDPGLGPDQLAEAGELSTLVRLALQHLPEEQRLAIVLADLQELDYREIAFITGWSMGTVKSRISRGRTRLRLHFSRHPELLAAYRRLDKRG